MNLAIIDKRRINPNEVSEMNVVGDVSGKVAVLIDDIVDTGGTLVKAADALIEAGATQVIACASHAVLSGHAKNHLKNSRLSKLIVTDTIQQDLTNEGSWIVQLSVAQLIGEAIKRINMDDSVSTLFGDE